jgi:TATA-box binding protein (TBP) (component of TFIID and TFIIIB)
MELKNIKVRYIFENDLVKKPNKQIIWKNEKLSFSIYKDAIKFINVTGLKSLQEIEQQKLAMEELFKQKIINVKIDNMFFSKKDKKNLDMCLLYNYLKENKNYFCNYNIELFAGMYLHPINKLYPTILLFRTGSYTLMGGKSLKYIHESEHFVKDLIQMFKK